MSDTLCIYHGNCADGFGAAWAVRKALGNIEFYPGVYQTPPPDVTGRDVILVDFSYRRPVLDEMAKTARSILILDHHKSAAEDLAHLPSPVSTGPVGPAPADWGHVDVTAGYDPAAMHDAARQCNGPPLYALFDMSRSGARIAWDFFHPGKEPPPLLLHIEDRDLWRFKLEGTRDIQAALFSYPYEFELWDMLMEEPVAALRRDGAAIERKHFKDINEFIAAAQCRMTIAGHDVPALNAPYFWSSDAGHIMAKGEPFAACYWDTPEGRVFSLRSDDGGLDVSEIAKLYGGGGHKAAAGFRLDHGKAP